MDPAYHYPPPPRSNGGGMMMVVVFLFALLLMLGLFLAWYVLVRKPEQDAKLKEGNSNNDPGGLLQQQPQTQQLRQQQPQPQQQQPTAEQQALAQFTRRPGTNIGDTTYQITEGRLRDKVPWNDEGTPGWCARACDALGKDKCVAFTRNANPDTETNVRCYMFKAFPSNRLVTDPQWHAFVRSDFVPTTPVVPATPPPDLGPYVALGMKLLPNADHYMTKAEGTRAQGEAKCTGDLAPTCVGFTRAKVADDVVVTNSFWKPIQKRSDVVDDGSGRFISFLKPGYSLPTV